MSYRLCVSGVLLLWTSSVSSFQEFHRRQLQRPTVALKSSNDGNDGPVFPSYTPPPEPEPEPEEPKGQANTRFSAFAPDPNLGDNEFRSQLMENMKADLERRRNEDPNRGNQIAKNYLDSL
eukprot:CAMPEP_0116139710 /NCGR_PEP_ID=MMETSP0329-20121206/13456_1 /TAXON_ID=697910 /ORGANISM="Pseudo-nitzschia arenysensis, Strain B593" /LENGTH=120 /DNA_ID=CAMNT_0003634769 /DNA_START=86 /DNA_END=448 /DNA_ORIENTATION=-